MTWPWKRCNFTKGKPMTVFHDLDEFVTERMAASDRSCARGCAA
jgi:hypothetical protein